MDQVFILRCEEAIAQNTPFTATVDGEQVEITLEQCAQVVAYRPKLTVPVKAAFDALPLENQLALAATVGLFTV